jgi:hypothetical protein
MSERASLADFIRQFCNVCNVTENADVTLQPAQTLGATSVTSVTPEKTNAEAENAPACTAEWFRAQGCEVLRDDLAFMVGRLPTAVRSREAVLRAYAACWLAAMDQEPVSHRKENAGRLAANTALREGLLQKGCSGTECA